MARCTFCDHDNPPGARSCEHCGATLAWSSEAQNSDPPDDLEARLRDLLADGRKIEAIKLYREHTGAGLKEAEDAVEALERGVPGLIPGGIDGPLEAELVALLVEGRKIEAIKRYRAATGVGLKEARDAVEALGRRHGLTATRQGSGCLGVILLFMMVVFGSVALARDGMPSGSDAERREEATRPHGAPSEWRS